MTHLNLFDWKTCKKIEGDSDKKISIPGHAWFATKINKYTFQLFLYKLIVETCYGYKVDHLYLVVFSQLKDRYEIIEIGANGTYSMFFHATEALIKMYILALQKKTERFMEEVVGEGFRDLI